MRRSFLKSCLGSAATALVKTGGVGFAFPSLALAEAYPARPIRLIVTFGAGGLADVVARLVAVNLTKELGQSVIIENRAGASGSIGAQAVARSAPDGYTLMSGTPATHVVNKLIYRDLPYDPIKDFKPVCLLSETPLVVTVSPSLKVASLGDLVDKAKKNPGKLTYASAGVGTGPHLSMELFQLATETKLLHVPFKGGGEAVNAVLAGQVDVFVEALPVVGTHIAAGTLRALAVPREERLKAVPTVPTSAEAGLPSYLVPSPWSGVAAPAATPAGQLAVLEKALVAALSDQDLRRNLESRGILVPPSGAKAYQDLIDKEFALWGRVVKTAGITVN